jgi:hypothetical protein
VRAHWRAARRHTPSGLPALTMLQMLRVLWALPVAMTLFMWSVLVWFAVFGHHRGYCTAVAVYTPGVLIAVVVVTSPFLVAAAGRWPLPEDGPRLLHDRWVKRMTVTAVLWQLTEVCVLFGAVYAADGERTGALVGYAIVSIVALWGFAPTRLRVRHDISRAARHGLDLAAVVFAPPPRRPLKVRLATFTARRRL